MIHIDLDTIIMFETHCRKGLWFLHLHILQLQKKTLNVYGFRISKVP